MNDIRVKIVESPSGLAGDVPLPSGRVDTAQNEVDPLAIDESERIKDSVRVHAEVADLKLVVAVEEKLENCDENAKEEIESESAAKNVNNRLLESESSKIKEELLKDDTSSIDSTYVNTNSVETNYEIGSPMDVSELEREDSIVPSKDIEPETVHNSLVVEENPTETPQSEINELSPAKDTETPMKEIDVLVEALDVKKNIIPIKETVVEVRRSLAPIKEATILVKEVVPIKENIVSVKEGITPVKEIKTPVKEVTALLKELTAPLKHIIHSEKEVTVKGAATTVKEVVTQVKETKSVNKTTTKEEQVFKPLEKVKEKAADVQMLEIHVAPKLEKPESGVDMAKPDVLPSLNGDVSKEDQPIKRRASEEVETESPLKKLCQEVEKTFPQHDGMINDYIQTATKNNVDEIQRHTEQLLSEIQTLRELAQKKEHEWNNILHLKKVKEEILLRLLRRKQVIAFEKAVEVNGPNPKDPFDYLNSSKNLAIDKSDEISGLALKPPTPLTPQPPMMQPQGMPVTTHFNPMAGLPPPYDKAAHMQGMPKQTHMFPQNLMMPGPTMPFPRDMNMNGQLNSFGLPMGRQGPTKDVKSIIADYRQRNPDISPRRGRRMKSMLNPNMMNAPRQIAPKVDNLSNIGMLFNNLDMNQKAMLERLSQIQGTNLPNGISFKDVLVQFANIQQQNANMMPIRPEIMPHRPDHHPPVRPEGRGTRRPERLPHQHEESHPNIQVKQSERQTASASPRLPPPPPYPEISLLPVNSNQEGQGSQQNSLLHGILTKQASPAPQSYSPTLAKLLTSPERKQKAPTLPTFGQAKNCGEITITPVQPQPQPDAPPEKTEQVVQLDDEESPQSEGSTEDSPEGSGGRLVIDEGSAAAAEPDPDAPLCQGCRRRDAQFVCAGCANQWYCSRDCQVAAWDEHSEMCSG